MSNTDKDQYPVMTPVAAQADHCFGLDTRASFGHAVPPNGIGLALKDVLASGRTVAIARNDGQGASQTPYAIYTILEASPTYGLIALRRWHFDDTMHYEDVVVPLSVIAAIQCPAPSEVKALFTRECERCHGAGSRGALHQPCDECGGEGEIVLKEATRLPFNGPYQL